MIIVVFVLDFKIENVKNSTSLREYDQSWLRL